MAFGWVDWICCWREKKRVFSSVELKLLGCGRLDDCFSPLCERAEPPRVRRKSIKLIQSRNLVVQLNQMPQHYQHHRSSVSYAICARRFGLERAHFIRKLFGNLSLHRLLNVALHLKFPVNFQAQFVRNGYCCGTKHVRLLWINFQHTETLILMARWQYMEYQPVSQPERVAKRIKSNVLYDVLNAMPRQMKGFSLHEKA